MDRCYKAGASQNPPNPPAAIGGYPTAGSKAFGQPPTTPGPYWFYSVTEEIRNCIVQSGQTPDASDLTQLWKAVVSASHPVGSVYMSTDPTSPAQLFGGTWVEIKDRMLIGAGGDFSVLSEGGEATHTLTVDELPAHTHTTSEAGEHTHTRGTQDITGGFSQEASGAKVEGAFTIGQSVSSKTSEPGGSSDSMFEFQASRTWTGETSEDGAHTHQVASTGEGKPFNTISPYLAVFMWRRTA